VQDLIGNAQPAAWIQAFAFLVLVVPMNLLVGGALLAAAAVTRPGADAGRLARWLTGILPGAAVATVACGLVSYGILSGLVAPGESSPPPWPLPEILGLLVVAAAPYLLLLRRRPEGPSPAAAWGLAACLATVALCCVSGAESGQSRIPRFVHLILAAVAVAGMMVGLRGLSWRRADPRFGNWAASWGMRWLAVSTGLQMVAGFYFLLSLTAPARSRFFGGSPAATAELVAGILLAVATLSAATHAAGAEEPRRPTLIAALLLAATLVSMALLREQVRSAGLLAFHPGAAAPHPSAAAWLGAVAALVSAIGGVLVWLTRILREPAPAMAGEGVPARSR